VVFAEETLVRRHVGYFPIIFGSFIRIQVVQVDWRVRFFFFFSLLESFLSLVLEHLVDYPQTLFVLGRYQLQPDLGLLVKLGLQDLL